MTNYKQRANNNSPTTDTRHALVTPNFKFTKSLVLIWLTIALFVPIWLALASPDIPLIQPDSGSYLNFSPTRTAGYPLFLLSAQAVGLSLELITWLQYFIYCTAIVGLFWSIKFSTNNLLLALLTTLVVAANIESAKYSFTILTDSLFYSVAIGICALIILCIFKFRLRWAVAFSILVGCAIMLRPVGYAFAPLLIIVGVSVYFYYKTNPWNLTIALLTPAVILILIEMVSFSSFHKERQSLLGRRLFAKSAFVSAPLANLPLTSNLHQNAWTKLEQDSREIRELLANAPNFGVKNYLASNYEVFFEYRFAKNDLKRSARANNTTVNSVMLDIGKRRLFQAPFQYMKIVWHHYRALWTPYAAFHPWTASDANSYLKKHRPMPLVAPEDTVNKPIQPKLIAYAIQPAFILGWIITAIFPLGCLLYLVVGGPVPKPLAAAAIFGLMTNGYFILVALFGVGIPRYTLAMQPPIALTGILAAYHFSSLIGRLIKYSRDTCTAPS